MASRANDGLAGPSFSEADESLRQIEQIVRKAVSEKKRKAGSRNLDYSWLDPEDAVQAALALADQWSSLLRDKNNKSYMKVQRSVENFLNNYIINQLGMRAFNGGDVERTRLIEELVNWCHAEVMKRKSDGSFARVEVEDAVQSVCLKVWKKFSQYQGNKPFSAWVRQIIYNTMIDLLRQSEIVRIRKSFAEENGKENKSPLSSGASQSESTALNQSSLSAADSSSGERREKAKKNQTAIAYNKILSLEEAGPGENCDTDHSLSLINRIVGSDGRILVEQSDFFQFVKKILAGHPNKTHAEVFRLFYFEDCSYREIAKQVPEIGIGGIGAILSRMRREIKKKAEDPGILNNQREKTHEK